MEALDVEMSIAEGTQALQALLKFVQENADQLEAHEAEKGIFKRLLPIGLAAMQLYFAQRGTGDVGPAVTRADGVILPRETQLRGRDYCSLIGKCAVARTCDHAPGEPGMFPLDAQVKIDGDTLRATTTFTVKQTDFGVRPFRGGPAGTVRVADKVTFDIRLVAVSQP